MLDMMRSVVFCGLLLALLLTLPGASPGAEAAGLLGVEFAERRVTGGHSLGLRGLAALRIARCVDVSVAGLYLESGVDPASVLADVPRRLEIEYLRGFRAIDFARSTRWFVRRNVGDERYGELEPEIELWNTLYRDVARGDRYALTYAPGSGTELALNGIVLGAMPGAELSGAIFSIWLGE